MTEKEILQNAASYIEQFGWCQGEFGSQGGPVCLLGALRCGAGFHPAESPPLAPDLSTYLDTVLRVEVYLGQGISYWNDAALRREQDVLDLLTKLASE